MSRSRLQNALSKTLVGPRRRQSNVAALPLERTTGIPISQLPGPFALPYLGSADMIKVMFSAEKRSNLHTLQVSFIEEFLWLENFSKLI